jgi:hypothetical protein
MLILCHERLHGHLPVDYRKGCRGREGANTVSTMLALVSVQFKKNTSFSDNGRISAVYKLISVARANQDERAASTSAQDQLAPHVSVRWVGRVAASVSLIGLRESISLNNPSSQGIQLLLVRLVFNVVYNSCLSDLFFSRLYSEDSETNFRAYDIKDRSSSREHCVWIISRKPVRTLMFFSSFRRTLEACRVIRWDKTVTGLFVSGFTILFCTN